MSVSAEQYAHRDCRDVTPERRSQSDVAPRGQGHQAVRQGQCPLYL